MKTLKFSHCISGLVTIFLLAQPASTRLNEHERLRPKNTFKLPEEVVEYYAARDASGFVWSGLLDIERRAFTLWKDVPQAEQFLVAKKYQVSPSREKNGSKDHALVEVKYELVGMSDAHGTMRPATNSDYRVTFDLAKVGGLWKIEKPDAAQVSPVVLQSKFSITSTK